MCVCVNVCVGLSLCVHLPLLIPCSLQTAVPLQFALFELGRNPEVQDMVRHQVRTSWAQADGDPQKALQGAPLLKATIKEVLRYRNLRI